MAMTPWFTLQADQTSKRVLHLVWPQSAPIGVGVAKPSLGAMLYFVAPGPFSRLNLGVLSFHTFNNVTHLKCILRNTISNFFPTFLCDVFNRSMQMMLHNRKTAQLPPSQTLRQVVKRNRRRSRERDEPTDGCYRSASAKSEAILILPQIV